jgi:uridine kinase
MKRSGPRSLSADPREASSPGTILVAIAGGSGAGKSWLARQLARRLRPLAGVLSLDDFYRDLSAMPPRQRDRVNFDAPEALDWEVFEEALSRIRQGEAALLPRYDFAEHVRKKRGHRWKPRPIVLVEGLWPWLRPETARCFALKIFIRCPESTRFERRLARDVVERGRTPRSVTKQWREQSEPMCRRHVTRQARGADVVLGADIPPETLDALADRIRRLIKRENP